MKPNCEKCRFYNPIYRSVGFGCWQICEFCMLGGCDGSQYEDKDEVEDTYCNDETCETFLRDLNCDNCTR